MSDSNPPNEPAPPTSPRRPRWGRRLAVGLLGLVLLLLVLLALAPTIAGSGFGRSIIEGQINKRILGKARIAQTSFAWFGGQQIGGVKVYDQNDALILEIDRVETGLALAGALRGNLAMGDTLVDLNLTRLQVDPEGRTNYEALLKPTDPGGPTPPAPESADAPLPNVSGKFTVRYRGTIEYVDRLGGQALSPPLILDPGEAVIDVPDINAAIANSIRLALRLGDKPAGTVEIAGSMDAIDNRRLDLDKLNADQRVTLAAIDFGALTPLLKLAGIDGTLAGVMDGQLALRADGLDKAGVEGQLAIANFAASDFPQLAGDSFRTASVAIPIRVSRQTGDGNVTLLKIESFRIDTPEVTVAVAGEVTEQSLANVAAGREPGEKGWMHSTVAVRDVTVLNQFPQLLRLQEGVRVTGGVLSQTFDLTLRRDKSFVKAKLDAALDGTRDGQRIAVSPISTTIDATYAPAADPMSGITDASVVLSSGFARLDGGGPTLDKLDFSGDFDLNKLQDQAAQFVDLGQVALRGSGTFSLATRGDLTKPESDVLANARFDLRGIDVRLPDQPQILIGAMTAGLDSTLRTDSSGGIARVGSAALSVTSGDTPGEKVLELVAAVTGIDLSTNSVERFEVSNLAITNLPKVQQQFGAFVPALKEQNIRIADGQFYTNAVGSYDGLAKSVVLSRPVEISTPNLTVLVGDAKVLNRERITARLGGRFELSDGIAADLSDLAVNSTLFSLAKGQGPLAIRLNENGALTGSGRIDATSDLARLCGAIQSMAPSEAAPQAKVTGGQFAGAIELRGGTGADSSITLDGAVRGLTVTSAGETPVSNEDLTVKSSLLIPADLTTMTADAHLSSSFVEARLLGGKLNLSTPQRTVGTYEMLDAVNIEAAVRDLPKLQALVLAFAPPDASANPEAATPDRSIRITSGGATLKASIARAPGTGTIRVEVPDMRISKLAMARGESRYAFDRETPISMKLAAELDAAGDVLRGVRVTQLAGDLRVAQLTMPTPIRIDLSGEQATAVGTVRLVGNLADAQDLLAVLDALPAGTTLAGSFHLDAGAQTAGNVVTATLSGTIDQFQVRPADQPALPPRQVTLDGLARIDTGANTLKIERFAFKLPENDTLAIDLTGGALVNLNDLLVKLDGAKVQYSYDLSQLWPLALPLLDPETQQTLADTKITGKLSRSLDLGGVYAASKPFHEAIAGVSGAGAFEVELLDSQGLVINSLAIPFALDKGILKISQTPPATANGGTLNLNGIVVDLTDPIAPRLSGPRRQRLLHNVSINPALGNTLGKYVNPSFPNSDRAQGLLDVTIDRLDGVALGEALFSEDSGSARIVFSITDMDIANPLGELMFGRVAGALRLGGGRQQATTFRGEIRDAVITLDRGRTTQQLTMQLTEDVRATDPVTGAEVTIPKNMPMSFSGDIRLYDLSQRLAVSLPPELVGRFINVSDKDMLRIFPDGVPISLRGTTTNPQVDLGNLVQRFAEGQIRSRIGGDGGGGNPFEDLLRGIGGGRRDRDERRR